jgi:uncharacterized membrane protein HdeD (DUF308 family)
MSYAWERSPVSLEPSRHRGWTIALGAALMILGAVAIGTAVLTTVISVTLFGWILAAGGVIQIAHAFSAPRWRGVVLSVVEGVLYLVIGLFVAARPLETAALVTLAASVFLVASGLFRILAVATFLEIPNRGWVLASGILSLLLGLVIGLRWPVTSLWLIGAFLGVEMIGWGLSLIELGLAQRDVDTTGRRHREAA